MKTGLLFSGTALLGLCLVSAFPGCGSSSNGNNASDGGQTGETSTDSSGSSSGGDDGSSGDANEESSGDTGVSCTATVMPTGKQIFASSTVTVQGVTSDGQVIFYDGNTQKLNAVAIGGGNPSVMGSWDKSQSVIFTSNKAALYWNGTGTQTTNVKGALSIWTASGGNQALGTASFFSAPGAGYVDVSADGSLVIYTDNVTSANADIYVAGTDGSNKVKLVSAASYGTNCRPVVRFAGNTAVVSYCTAQPDAGTTLTANVEAYSSAPTWQTKQSFATGDGFYGFSLGPIAGGDGGASGYNIAYLTNAGEYVEAIGGTTPTLIDAKGAGGGIFMHNGTDLIYFENDGSVWRSPIATPAPAELATGPYAGSLGLSSDDNWLELYLSVDSTTQFTTDMYLVSTTPGADGGNAPFTLTNTTKGANFGDAFTADNTHVLFFPNVVMSGSAGYVGAYDTFALPPPVGMMPKTIAQNVWEEFATSGAKTLYNDNYASNAGFAGAADIEAVDLAGTAMATTLVSQADANFFLTADKKTIVYSWSACPGAKDGIYTVAAP